jgi:uncharacterized membrane protein
MKWWHNYYVTVLMMACVVYVCRCGGYWLAGRVTFSDRLRNWLGYLPGCIMISIVAPLLRTASMLEWLGAVVTIGVMLKIDNLLIAMSSGMAIVALFRLLGWAG